MQQRLRILRPATLRDELDAAARALPPPALGSGDRTNADTPDIVTAGTDPGGTAEALALVDAHLACGDFSAVLGLVRTARAHPMLPIVLARYVRWSGDLQTAAATWDSIIAVLPDGAAQHVGEPWLARATAVELAPLATDLGHVELAARLHRIARTAEARTLPDAGDANASTIRRIALETLGTEPDAVRGRLRLRPRLDQLRELEVRDIRFGDASIRMAASVRPGSVEIVVEQESGGIPVTVLLEPYVAADLADPPPAMVDGQPGLADSLYATVDGQPATLTPQAADYGTIIPVQLVLDDVRTVVLGDDRGVSRHARPAAFRSG